MRWWLLLLLLVGACGGPPGPLRAPPEPPRDLNVRTSGVIYPRLMPLFAQPDRCFALLKYAAGIEVRREANVQETPLCGRINTATLKTTPVAFARPTQVTCPMAAALFLWQRDALIPLAQRHLGSTVARIETFGTYACRSRNNQPGAQLSEHARANAIDISAFVLADGRRIRVVDGWRSDDRAVRSFLRDALISGCRYFAVALGPDSDRFHQDHLHFDLGRWAKCG